MLVPFFLGAYNFLARLLLFCHIKKMEQDFSISSKYFKFLKNYMFDLVVTIQSPETITSLLDTYVAHF